ncbi:MAG: site-specific DNA-methyltransferase [Planctomycetes bacterium]|nr:site-specific DNA-methyltransferase [Planctomycetota bacterium]
MLTATKSQATNRRITAVRGRRDGWTSPRLGSLFRRGSVLVENVDCLTAYAGWPCPIAIVSDGPYGLGSFPGDPPTSEGLAAWYRPHIEAWSRFATPQTTLWFWNSELGWATVHPELSACGWTYRCCHIWDKGIGHVAGNSNTQTLRKLPVVTEVCVQYTREATFPSNGTRLAMKEWLRREWERTGLPFSVTNEACGVKDAATRKYFTSDRMWYYPPVDAFERLVEYANRHGKPEGRPYFSVDGSRPITGEEWARMRAKFYCPVGETNVWREPPVRGAERLKRKAKCIHLNQKPLRLMELIIRMSTGQGDVVWEPFGGLCTAALAALRLGRRCFAAEINPEFFTIACKRLSERDLFDECEAPRAS